MRVVRFLAVRLTVSVFAVWAALSGVFFAFAYSPDDLQWKAGPGATRAYRRARNYDDPVLDRYVAWVDRYLHLDLGTSVYGTPIDQLLATRLEHTLAYLLPSVVVALALAAVLGYLLATRKGTALDTAGTAVVYFWYGVPAFVLAAAIYWTGVDHLDWHSVRYSAEYGFYTARNLPSLIAPALITTGNMLAVWLRYVRLESVELLDEEFVRALRASGAGPVAVFVHVLRNASKTLVTAFFVEIVSVMVLTTVVVETVLQFPGYGSLVYEGVFTQDIGVIMGTMLVPVGLAVLGNLLQDVAYPYLDPRVAVDRRR